MFWTKFITSLLEVVLGLLQPLQPVLHLQINVRILKMVPNESPYQKPLVWYQNQVSRMIRTQFISSCHDAILGLLQTPHPVRDLQFEMRHLKMVPKHWVWHQNQVYQSNNFTPWSCSWPPTAPPPCSWPSDQSEALVNGPKWFSIPKNHGLDTKLKCLAWTEAKLQYMQFWPKIPIFGQHSRFFKA